MENADQGQPQERDGTGAAAREPATPDEQEAALKAHYPANAYEPADEPFTDSAGDARRTGLNAYPADTHPAPGMASATGVTAGTAGEPVSKVQGKYPSNVEHEPMLPAKTKTQHQETTGTPGGALGAPDEGELKSESKDDDGGHDAEA